MQANFERLLDQFKQGKFAPSYFFYGDEPLQLNELSDALRKAVAAHGIEERLSFAIENVSDWDRVEAESAAMSLFSSARLIEIRMAKKKPDKRGTAVLEQILGRSDNDDIFVISADYPDASGRRARWFKMLEKDALSFHSREIKPNQLPAWLQQRARRHQKTLARDAAELIADRVEGNLLAAAQEIEKLVLIINNSEISADDVIGAVNDNARFDVFQLVDAAMAGELARALRISRGLRENGIEAVIVCWALGRELHQLTQLAEIVGGGMGFDQACEKLRVWQSRRGLIRRVMKRHRLDAIRALLKYANRTDTVIKGGRKGNAWDEIEILLMNLCQPMRNCELDFGDTR